MKQQSNGRSIRWTVVSVLLLAVCMGCPETLTDKAQSAAASHIVDTGQTICYGERDPIAPPATGERFHGQDAQYLGNPMAYRDNGDGTVTDLNTGLMWQQTPPNAMFSWQDAAPYADALRLAGHTDWRVPTIKELYSLAAFYGDINRLTPYINTGYFDFYYPDTSQGHRIIDAQYWSSNAYVGPTMFGDAAAFGFNFADGRIKAYPANTNGGPMKANFVRCVRGAEGYGENAFVDNNDGTVSDTATGLMWTKNDSAGVMTWEQALAWAESLDYAGHSDWRLPNAKELQSIVDYSRAPDASDPAMRTAAIDPVFGLTETESWCWTSTTHNDNLGGIYICFGRALAYDAYTGMFSIDAHGAGAQRSDPKTGDPNDYPQGLGPQGDQIRIYNYARCVRGGAVPVTADDPPEDPGDPNDPGDPPGPPPGGPPTFEELDVDGNGTLSLSEALAIPFMDEALFNEFDTDGDGALSREELPPPPDDPNDPQDPPGPPPGGPPTFEELDADGNGTLSLSEALAIPFMDEALFNEFDTDGDGALSREELPPPPDDPNDPQDPPGPPPGGPPTFEELDVDGNGTLSLSEALAIPFMDEALFNELDTDGDGALSREELPPPPDDPNDPNDPGDPPGPPPGGPPTFEDLDADGNGTLSLSEALAIPFMDEVLFNESDTNGDGALSREELPPPPDDPNDPDDPGDPPGPPPGGPPTFEDLDTDGNGTLSLSEALAIPFVDEALFNELDTNGDGALSREELPPPPDGPPAHPPRR
ncbi:MAG: DUF1566 domain-containing protein [bacterium]|nr:DUF1566 domain-containing protein [bacterium]